MRLPVGLVHDANPDASESAGLLADSPRLRTDLRLFEVRVTGSGYDLTVCLDGPSSFNYGCATGCKHESGEDDPASPPADDAERRARTLDRRIVKKLHAEVGQRVVRGQPLATLDPEDRLLTLKQAGAGHALAEVAFATAEKDFKRFSSLEAGGTITRADQKKAELGYKAAKHQLEQAAAAVGLARNYLADSVVRAPFDGQVTMRVAQLGSYVDPMMHPVMFVLVDSSRLKVGLNLPEARAGLLAPGDEVTVDVPASRRSFVTKVEILTDTVDPMTRTRTAIAWVDNPGPDPVPSGSFFEARVMPAALKGRIVLPLAAIRSDEQGRSSVYVVLQGQSRKRELQGRFLADRGDFLVESGLEVGETVVAEASMVRDGQPVEPVLSRKPAEGPR